MRKGVEVMDQQIDRYYANKNGTAGTPFDTDEDSGINDCCESCRHFDHKRASDEGWCIKNKRETKSMKWCKDWRR